MVIKNAGDVLSAALAVLRKLGTGDPIKFLKEIDWKSITKQATDLIKEKVIALRDALNGILDSWIIRKTLSDDALASIKKNSEQLTAILPNIEKGIEQGCKEIQKRINKAINDYKGEVPHTGRSGELKKAKAKEQIPEKGNDLKGAPPIKRVRDPALEQHYKNLAEYEAAYQKKLAKAKKNGDSNSRIGAFKAKLTEVKGERAASAYMEKHFSKPPPPAQMEMGFGPGPGFDQIWAKRDKNGNVLEYFIVEAKGPGAKLGKGATKGDQMTDKWINNTISSMQKSKKYKSQNEIGKNLARSLKSGDPKVNNLVIEAIEENGKIIGGKLQPLP